MSSRTSRSTISWSPKSSSSASTVRTPWTRRRAPSFDKAACQRACGARDLAIAARPVEVVDGEVEAAVGGEGAQGIGCHAHAAAGIDVVHEAGEAPLALERRGEVVEVEAGDAAVRERRQRAEARDRDVRLPGDGAARAIEAERGVERELGAAAPRGGDDDVRRRGARVEAGLGRQRASPWDGAVDGQRVRAHGGVSSCSDGVAVRGGVEREVARWRRCRSAPSRRRAPAPASCARAATARRDARRARRRPASADILSHGTSRRSSTPAAPRPRARRRRRAACTRRRRRSCWRRA